MNTTLMSLFAQSGMEDSASIPAEVVITPEVAVIQEQDQVVAEVQAEVAEQETAIVQLQAAMDDMEERIEDVEEEQAGLEAMIKGETSWNPELAKAMFNRARKAANKLSFGGSIEAVEGNESFMDKDAANMALASGMEAIGETAKKAWETVKRFFINLYNTTIAIITGLFNALAGLSKKADALKTRLANTPDDKMKKEVKLGKWNLYLSVKKDGGENGIVTNAISKLKSILNDVQKALASNDLEAALSACKKLPAEMDNKKNGPSDDNLETIYGEIANITFTIVLPKAGAKDLTAAMKKVSVSYKPSKDAKVEGTVTALSKSALGTIISSVKSDIEALHDKKFERRSLETARDQAVSKAERAEVDGKDEKDARKKNAASIKAAHSAGLTVAKASFKYGTSLCAARLSYVAAHF